jgi:hypothetical protein
MHRNGFSLFLLLRMKPDCSRLDAEKEKPGRGRVRTWSRLLFASDSDSRGTQVRLFGLRPAMPFKARYTGWDV